MAVTARYTLTATANEHLNLPRWRLAEKHSSQFGVFGRLEDANAIGEVEVLIVQDDVVGVRLTPGYSSSDDPQSMAWLSRKLTGGRVGIIVWPGAQNRMQSEYVVYGNRELLRIL